MRNTVTAAGIAFALLLAPVPAHAEPPDTALALFTGAATTVAGFAAGALLLGTSNDRNLANNAGWLTMQGGFALAPLCAHAVVGEWSRGALFATAPAAMWGGSVALMEYAPNVVGHGTLEEQRVLWGFFGVAFFSSAVGIVDATFAGSRAAERVRVAPMATRGGAGLSLEGLL